MASGLIIDYLGFGDIGDRPASPDLHTGALGLYWATDEDILYVWDGAWGVATDGFVPTPAPVVTESTTSRAATPANSGEYVRFTHDDPKTFTFDDAETYVMGAEYYGRNVGAGELTLTEAGTFTLNPPADGTLVVPQGGSFAVKIVAADEADVTGYTEAA